MAIIAHSEVHDRFMSKVDVSGDCWEWRAAKDPSGYGAFKYQGAKVGAHRISYEMHRGPIPDGLWLDHLCRNRACVRPGHLEPVKPGENTRRGLLPVVNALRGLARTPMQARTPSRVRELGRNQKLQSLPNLRAGAKPPTHGDFARRRTHGDASRLIALPAGKRVRSTSRQTRNPADTSPRHRPGNRCQLLGRLPTTQHGSCPNRL